MVTEIHEKSMFAKRVERLEASGIRKIFELAASMKNPINLSIGQPDFDVPEPIKEAAVKAIREGHNKYTVTQGLPALNERILDSLRQRYGLKGFESLVTAGVSGGLVLTFLTLLEPGDEVLLPDPYFILYRQLINLCSAVPKFYNLYPDFKIRPDALESLVSEKTKLLILNSPSNPTGKILTSGELRSIAAFAKKNDLIVISDEIYDRFVYDGASYESVSRYYDQTIILGGYSKSLGMPGWRLGYAVGPPEIVDMMRTLQQFTFVCATTPAQMGVLNAFDTDISEHVEEYRKKRDMVYEGIKDNYEVIKPEGAFYMFPKVPVGSDTAFIKLALEKNLLLVPGSACSNYGSHFRISYAASDEMLKRGIDVLNEIARELQ